MSDKFEWQDGDIVLSQCVYCAHKGKGVVCTAFPGGIPGDILENNADHRQSYAGDGGVQFEQREGGPKAPFERIFPT